MEILGPLDKVSSGAVELTFLVPVTILGRLTKFSGPNFVKISKDSLVGLTFFT